MSEEAARACRFLLPDLFPAQSQFHGPLFENGPKYPAAIAGTVVSDAGAGAVAVMLDGLDQLPVMGERFVDPHGTLAIVRPKLATTAPKVRPRDHVGVDVMAPPVVEK